MIFGEILVCHRRNVKIDSQNEKLTLGHEIKLSVQQITTQFMFTFQHTFEQNVEAKNKQTQTIKFTFFRIRKSSDMSKTKKVEKFQKFIDKLNGKTFKLQTLYRHFIFSLSPICDYILQSSKKYQNYRKLVFYAFQF